jgi:hypothetical protein
VEAVEPRQATGATKGCDRDRQKRSFVSLPCHRPFLSPPPHPPHPPGPADRHDRQFETCSGPGESSVRLSGSRKCVQNVRFFISGGAKREGEKRAGTAIVRSAYAQFPPYVATAIRCSAFRGWVELGWEAGQKETRDLRDIACQILSRYSALAPGFIS